MATPRGRLDRAIIVLLSVGFGTWGAFFIYRSSFVAIDGSRYFCLFDDAMISMRYAWNLSHGLGLVWNPGEYVEGYTNLLMTLVMAAATFVLQKSNAVLLMQALGVGLVLAIAYVNARLVDTLFLARNNEVRPAARLLAFASVVFYYPLAYWSLMGMETGLLTLLLSLAVLWVVRYEQHRDAPSLFLASACLGLAYLTRNDSLILAIPLWLCVGWANIKRSAWTKENFWTVLRAVFLYAALIGTQVLFRYLYYGSLFPNTYTLKLTGLEMSARI